MSRHSLAKNTPKTFSHAAKQTAPEKKPRNFFRLPRKAVRHAKLLVVKKQNLRGKYAPVEHFTPILRPGGYYTNSNRQCRPRWRSGGRTDSAAGDCCVPEVSCFFTNESPWLNYLGYACSIYGIKRE